MMKWPSTLLRPAMTPSGISLPPLLDMHLQTHCGTPHKSGCETKIEGTFWCDVNRMDFMFAHVRANHQEKYQASKGKVEVVVKKPRLLRNFLIQDGWMDVYCPAILLGPLSVEHYIVIKTRSGT